LICYLPAFIAAIIWSYSILVYRDLSIKTNALVINIWRLIYSVIFLTLLSILFSSGLEDPTGLYFAAISGFFTLGIGDSLYFYSCVYAGASVATPIIYTYIILIQLTATLYGERLTLSKFLASILAFLGIYLLARKKGDEGKDRIKGIILSLIAMVMWVIGQTAIKPAVISTDVINVTLFRALAGVFTLIVIMRILGVKWVIEDKSVHVRTSFFGILDIGIGALLYIFSISLIGLSLTVILTSLMPLFTQILAVVTKREKVSYIEFISAILILLAIAISIYY